MFAQMEPLIGFFLKRNSLDFFSIKTFIQPSNKKLKQSLKWIHKDKFNLKKNHWILNVNLAMTCFLSIFDTVGLEKFLCCSALHVSWNTNL